MHAFKRQPKYRDRKQKLSIFRSSEPLKSVLMWGVNYSISQINHVNPRAVLLHEDFKAFLKIKVTNHHFDHENMPDQFKFKEYCPMVFFYLRQRFHIPNGIILKSFTQNEPMWDTTQSKTGQRYMLSYDQLFFVKVISSDEVANMHRILANYHEYLVKKSFVSLLPQYLAMYRLSVNEQVTYLVVMRNLLSPRISILKKYDLKGFTVRSTSEKELIKEIPILKDVDFLNEKQMIHIGSSKKAELLEVLSSDVDFLQTRNYTNYSLMVAISEFHGITLLSFETRRSQSSSSTLSLQNLIEESFSGQLNHILEWSAVEGLANKDHQYIYFVGLVDMLTVNNVKQMTAQTYKNLKNRASIDLIPSPTAYAKRLLTFIESHID